jgi:CRP-like cAMP-binding protein
MLVSFPSAIAAVSPPAASGALRPRSSNRLLASLSAADLALLGPFRESLLPRGMVLHEPGTRIEHVYFPLGGMISLVMRMRGGETVEIVSIGREGALGTGVALGIPRALPTAIVQLPGMVVRIPAAQFQEAASRSSTVRQIASCCNELLIANIQQSVGCSTLHDAEARLSRFLLQTADCIGGGLVPLTQDVVAQMLGVRRTTVTIVARLLKAAGLIRYRRGQIHIVDRAALEKKACECYGSVRELTDRLLSEGLERKGERRAEVM